MATSFKQGFNEIGISLVRARLRLAGTIFKPGEAVLLKAIDPLISSLPAYAIVKAQLGDRLSIAKEIGDEESLKVHRR